MARIVAAENASFSVRPIDLPEFLAGLAPCPTGIEACATAHHWARELIALGQQLRLVSPSDVKADIERGKNDAADAEAICEAVRRPSMRFVPVKSEEQNLFPLGSGLPPPTPCGFPGAPIVVLDLTVAQKHPESNAC